MTPTLTVPIGPNAHIDGGPFVNFEGDGSADPGEPLTGTAGEGGEHDESFHLGDIGNYLRSEMRSHEPIHLSTGDVGEGSTLGTIQLPLVPGFVVDVHDLPGQGKDLTALIDSLADDELRRRSFERGLKVHGGSIESV